MLLNGKKTVKYNFFEFATKEIKDLKNKDKFGNAQSYETAVNRLVGFAGVGLTLIKLVLLCFRILILNY